MEAPSIHTPNPELERYATVRQIGAGGMATVYLAQDLLLGREVALKMLHAHLINSPESVQRFQGEAHAVASISHENVVRIFDSGREKSRPYLVMEFIQGMTLKDIFDRYGSIPNMVVVEICRQILLGLVCAHGRGVIHRDIKPDNIMIDSAGTVKITDFGIAYIVNKESLTLTGSLIGSPRAMSPEQARGKPLSGTTDIFSLGVLLYTALTSNPPFDADVASAIVHAIINDNPDPVYRKNGATLFWLSDFVDKCLIKDPVQRPDAESALSYVEKQCVLYGLQPGRDRIIEFLKHPDAYRAEEEQELFGLFRARSRDAIKKKQILLLFKSLEQAKAFGVLPKGDRNIIALYNFRRNLKSFATFSAAVMLIFLGFFSLLHALRIRSVEPNRGGVVPQNTPLLSTIGVPAYPGPFQRRFSAQGRRSGSGESIDKNTVIIKKPGFDEPLLPEGLRPLAGFILVKSNPPWAKVFVDGMERGMTPTLSILKESCGEHALTIQKDGFFDYHAKCAVAETDTAVIRAQLVPIPRDH